MAELHFRDTAAAGYDRNIGEMTRRIAPFLLRAARLTRGQRVLDIATGTGLAAEAATRVLGPKGHIVAADISPAMLDRARARLGHLSNVSFAVEDGQSLTFADQNFDALLCNMGLMYFPDPARGLSEFHRVLRPGGRAAISVFTRADRALVGGLVRDAIARHVPATAAEAAHFISVGDEQYLRALFDAAGFAEFEIATETLTFAFPSFDDYFGSVERGEGNVGQEFTALPEEVRHAIREEVRHEVGDTGGPIEVEVEVRIVGARR